MDDRSEGSLIETDHAHRQKQKIINKPPPRRFFLHHCVTIANWCDIGRMTIDILPDDILLVIFDHYVAEADDDGKYEGWQMLVHVCQNWRYVVFQSPLRLDLRILCSAETPVREKLTLLPQLPIIIAQSSFFSTSKCGEDNIIAALGHNDRICKIALAIPSSLLERVFAAMQKTFVTLKHLWLYTMDDTAPIVPDSFLGGSAPHLRYLWLTCIPFPFPVLRKLLLSAPNLVIISLRDIPHSGYFSPEAIVTCLSALTRLKRLCIEFKSPRSRPPRGRRHHPRTLSVLPALIKLTFVGVSEYFEDLVTQIDAPLLNQLYITFFHQLVFDTPQLVQFISHTPTLKAYDEARMTFSDSCATISLPWRDNLGLQLRILCRQSDWQLSSLAQVCASFFPQALIPIPEHLYIEIAFPRPLWQDDLEDNQWLDLFHPFTTVKNLYLSREFIPRIVPILQELVGVGVTEVLPNLQTIFMEDLQESGYVPENIREFVAARQLSGHPIAISSWTRQDKWSTTWYQ